MKKFNLQKSNGVLQSLSITDQFVIQSRNTQPGNQNQSPDGWTRNYRDIERHEVPVQGEGIVVKWMERSALE